MGELDVFPMPAMYDIQSRLLADSKKESQFVATESLPMQFPKIQNVICRQLGFDVALPARNVPLSGAILPIRLISAEEKMVGADARRRIAVMANQHAIGDFAKVQNPRKAMRVNHFRAVPDISISATTALSSKPEPTGICFVDARPITFVQVHDNRIAH